MEFRLNAPALNAHAPTHAKQSSQPAATSSIFLLLSDLSSAQNHGLRFETLAVACNVYEREDLKSRG
eukprot:1798457-Amphidinium_carterae.1